MAVIDSDRDMDLIDPSETDDETLYRLATPTDRSADGENFSDENENYEESHFVPSKRNKVKLSTKANLAAKFRRNSIGGQSLTASKRGKSRKGRFGGKKGREFVKKTVRSDSPKVVNENDDSDECRIFCNPNQYPNSTNDRVMHESPNLLPQSRGARGNYSDRFLGEERLSRALRSERPDGSVVDSEANNSKQPTFAPSRDTHGGGRSQDDVMVGGGLNNEYSYKKTKIS